MNRRLIMSQQNKGFELVYDAASGYFPDSDEKWTFLSSGYGNLNTRTIDNGLLYTNANHLGAFQRYRPTGHLQAKRSEVIIEVDSWSTYSWNDSSHYQGCILGVALTDGTYYAACNLTDRQLCIGKASNRAYVSSGGIWANLKNINYVPTQKFTFRMVFDSGIAYYYIDDELLYTQTKLLDESTIESDQTLSETNMANTIRFGCCAHTYISKIIYKEW